MPVLGADPTEVERDFPEFTPTVYVSAPIRSLVNHFGYHKGMTMNQRFNEKDKAILGRYFSQSMKSGHTDEALRKLVDRFWQTWGGDSPFPALAFTSTEMQDKLQERSEVRTLDPILQWLQDGMPDDGPFYNGKHQRRIVLMGARGLELRYPDVVAAVLREDDDEEWCVRVLTAINNVVRWHLSETDERPEIGWFSEIELPYELAARTKKSTKIRAKRDTVNRAIATIPRKKK